MPYKKKTIKSAERQEASEKLDRLILIAPPHIKARMGQPSRLAESLHARVWKGLVVTADGQMGLHTKHVSGANEDRQQRSIQRALKLREDYPDLFAKRGGASLIARHEGIDPTTVRRAIKKLNGQAK